jgi:hypothetical protein
VSRVPGEEPEGMIIPAKNFGPDCTVEIVAYNTDGYKATTVYADNIIEGMELAEEFYKLNDAVVEVCERDNGRWRLSYMIEPYRGWLKDADELHAAETALWAEGSLDLVF